MTAAAKPELTVVPTAAAELPGAFSREQIELIKDTIARDQKLTDDEFRLFIYTAQRLGLDPLAKQIYAVRRKGKMVLQAGIDGYRLVAARTGEYAGSDDAVFEGEVDGRPTKATVTVYRLVGGARCAFSASARWIEYCPAGDDVGFMWRKMPFTMLGKCAESLALRKAFPAQCAGVYTDVEMEQAGAPDAPRGSAIDVTTGEVLGDPVSTDQVQLVFAEAAKAGLTKETFPAWHAEVLGRPWGGALYESDVRRLLEAAAARIAERKAKKA